MPKRPCACGCGKLLRSPNIQKKYLNDAHRNRAWARVHRPRISGRNNTPVAA